MFRGSPRGLPLNINRSLVVTWSTGIREWATAKITEEPGEVWLTILNITSKIVYRGSTDIITVLHSTMLYVH
jgi:hypothetical protein